MSKQIWAVNNHHKFGRIREKLILAGGQACYSIQPQFMRKGAFLKKSEIIWNYDILWILQICKLLDGNSEAQKYYVKDLLQFRLRLPTEKRVKLCADHPANIDRAEERFWSKCARPSLIPPVPPAFVSQLGSWGHASASILIITISILLSCMRSNDAIRDLPRLLLVYARRQAMPCEASPNGIYVFLIIDQSR